MITPSRNSRLSCSTFPSGSLCWATLFVKQGSPGLDDWVVICYFIYHSYIECSATFTWCSMHTHMMGNKPHLQKRFLSGLNVTPSLSALTWEKLPLAGDKVRNLMPIQLATLYFSVKGVNLEQRIPCQWGGALPSLLDSLETMCLFVYTFLKQSLKAPI